MRTLINYLNQIKKKAARQMPEDGHVLVEYVFLWAPLFGIIVISLPMLGGAIGGAFDNVGTNLRSTYSNDVTACIPQIVIVEEQGKGNNGHGNNEDGVDVSNPGKGKGGPNGKEDESGDVDDEIKQNGGEEGSTTVTQDDCAGTSSSSFSECVPDFSGDVSGKGNNGHGNNEDGVDVSNPGKGKGGPNGKEDESGDVDDEIKDNNGNQGSGEATVYDCVETYDDIITSISFSTAQDTPLAISAADGLVQTADRSIHTADTASQFGGTVQVNADGSFSYTPAARFAGVDTFEFTSTSGDGVANPGTAAIVVDATESRSVQVNVTDWELVDYTLVSGEFTIKNKSKNGYSVQVNNLDIVLEYKERNSDWLPLDISNCIYSDEPMFLIDSKQTERVTFTDCRVDQYIPPTMSDMRLTARVQISGSSGDSWYQDLLSK